MTRLWLLVSDLKKGRLDKRKKIKISVPSIVDDGGGIKEIF